MIYCVYRILIFLRQLKIRIDELNHKIFLHREEDSFFQVLDRNQAIFFLIV